MANVRSSVNQKVQIGVEVTRGTPVACSKVAQAFTWVMGGKPTTKQFRGTGRQYESASALLYTESSAKVTGAGDFAQLNYILSGLWGAPVATAHSPSITAFDNVWTPPLTGSYAASAKALTVQMGDAIDAEQYTFVVFNEFGYKITRKQEVTIDAAGISQDFTDGATLTSSPTEIEQVPMTGAQFNMYLDPTSGALGTTLLTDVQNAEFKASGYYKGYYPINRANSSFTDLVDDAKKNDLTFEMQANSTALALRSTYLNTGVKAYIRIAAVGPVIDAGNSVHAAMTHDMAVFITGMEPFSDSDGVYAVKFSACVAEDAAWSSGTAQIFTLTNLLNGLS